MANEHSQELIGLFLTEAQEYLQSLEENLLVLEDSHDIEVRSAAIRTLFRVAHSLKGAALMFGLTNLSKAAHRLEDSFAILRDRANLATIESKTITALLEGVDHLQGIGESVEDVVDLPAEKIEAIAAIKQELEKTYGKQAPLTPVTQHSTNPQTIKTIFGQDIPPLLERLETELSQVTEDTLENAIAVLNDLYYQLSGVAGMLQIKEFGEITQDLQTLIDRPNLTVKDLQESGWDIAQKLETARSQVVEGKPVTVTAENPTSDPSEADAASPQEENEENGKIVETPNPNTSENGKETATPDPPKPEKASPHTIPATSTWQRPTIRVDLERLNELVNLVGELVINRTHLELQESQLRKETRQIRKNIYTLNQFKSQLREEYDRLSNVESRGDIEDFLSFSKKDTTPDFDSLEMDSYGEFHSTAQSVIETTATLSDSATNIDHLAQNIQRSTDLLRRITDNLRSRVMQLRVVPFSRAVDHLPRALRELCRLHNKEVNLLLLGRDTSIDESLIEALRDPLIHLLRNAFDHGIENPEERKAVGKPPSGQIEIEARHQGGQTIITISDDGRGIDPEKLRAKVIENGFMPPEEASELSVAQLYEFLFVPGFSTASEVTSLSGRGVGLDVVSNNLRQVRGLIKVDSRIGKGTSFIIKLPLLLSIAEALLVQIDRNTVAVPLDAVEEILHVDGDEIQIVGKQPMLRWRDEFIRLRSLQDLLHYHVSPNDAPSPSPLAQDHIPVMVLSSSEGVLAVAVERLVGLQEIVIKALPIPLSKPMGVVGNTILGNGEVVTILDVDDLIAQYYQRSDHEIALDRQAFNNAKHLTPTLRSQPQILVVDDSYTIRQLLSLTLTRARYRVIQAKDGQDALNKLNQGIQCDLVIADIEMPRMDGFELLETIKSHPTYDSIPVAMLTSRSGYKHRQRAKELGAADYFTKPYNEGQILDAIAKLIPVGASKDSDSPQMDTDKRG